jgi:Smg protein
MDNFLQILLYLYSRQRRLADISIEQNEPLLEDFVDAGFVREQARSAITWLQQLKVQGENHQDIKQISLHAFRVYTAAENEKLTYEARGFILFLEQAGVLEVSMRELLIDTAMNLESPIIDLVELRCLLNVVLLPNLPAGSPMVTAFNLLFANNGTIH